MYLKRASLVAAGLLALAVQPAMSEVTCDVGETLVPVSGKALNNAVHPGMTLGVIHLNVGTGKNVEKIKCGLTGSGGVDANTGTIGFVHSFVCDDQVVFPMTGETVHSQLIMNTAGQSYMEACPDGYPPGAATGSFQETSVPIAGTGRGIFDGVERGEIHVDGTINCLFSIDMKFTGEVCLPTM